MTNSTFPDYSRNVYAMSTVITHFVPTIKEHQTEHQLLLTFLETFWQSASLIDQIFDTFKVSENNGFSSDFEEFFSVIQHAVTKKQFVDGMQQFGKKFALDLFSLDDGLHQLNNLYQAFTICKQQDIMYHVKEFCLGMAMVSKNKRIAKTPEQIINILQDENILISNLFSIFLQTFESVDSHHKNFARMNDFLFLGEQVRNVFDDILDAHDDKKMGEISLPLDYNYYFQLSRHFLKNNLLLVLQFGDKLPMILAIIMNQYCKSIISNRRKIKQLSPQYS